MTIVIRGGLVGSPPDKGTRTQSLLLLSSCASLSYDILGLLGWRLGLVFFTRDDTSFCTRCGEGGVDSDIWLEWIRPTFVEKSMWWVVFGAFRESIKALLFV